MPVLTLKPRLIIVLPWLLILTNNSLAQLSITSLDTDFTINFESTVSGANNGTFTAGGFEGTPASGSLDIDGFVVTGFSDGDLTFGGSDATTGDYTRGSSTGGGNDRWCICL